MGSRADTSGGSSNSFAAPHKACRPTFTLTRMLVSASTSPGVRLARSRSAAVTAARSACATGGEWAQRARSRGDDAIHWQRHGVPLKLLAQSTHTAATVKAAGWLAEVCPRTAAPAAPQLQLPQPASKPSHLVGGGKDGAVEVGNRLSQASSLQQEGGGVLRVVSVLAGCSSGWQQHAGCCSSMPAAAAAAAAAGRYI